MADDANKQAASEASGPQGAEEDSETEERGQEPDLGTAARQNVFDERLLSGNFKRTYDEYQQLGLETARQALRHADGLATIQMQILSNMAENARLGMATAIRNGDQIATVHANVQQSQVNASQAAPGSSKA